MGPKKDGARWKWLDLRPALSTSVLVPLLGSLLHASGNPSHPPRATEATPALPPLWCHLRGPKVLPWDQWHFSGTLSPITSYWVNYSFCSCQPARDPQAHASDPTKSAARGSGHDRISLATRLSQEGQVAYFRGCLLSFISLLRCGYTVAQFLH